VHFSTNFKIIDIFVQTVVEINGEYGI